MGLRYGSWWGGGGTRFAVRLLWLCVAAHVATLHRRLTEESPLRGGG